jgi:transposase
MTAMNPQMAAATIEIRRLKVLVGPTGLKSISNGATPRSSTTAATMKRVKRSRLRAPRYAESQSK